MTNDYIRREDAVDAICSECTVDKPTTCSTIIKGDNWCEEVHILLNLPPADVIPVVHAYWRDTGSGQECSACKEIQYGYDTGRHYCPNCGAKMDGKEQNV